MQSGDVAASGSGLCSFMTAPVCRACEPEEQGGPTEELTILSDLASRPFAEAGNLGRIEQSNRGRIRLQWRGCESGEGLVGARDDQLLTHFEQAGIFDAIKIRDRLPTHAVQSGDGRKRLPRLDNMHDAPFRGAGDHSGRGWCRRGGRGRGGSCRGHNAWCNLSCRRHRSCRRRDKGGHDRRAQCPGRYGCRSWQDTRPHIDP
jgi:hypothetical protein